MTVIEKVIADRDLRPGMRLPTERELAQLSGQSRTSVRQVLDQLEAEGRIVRQVGRGTFLAPDVTVGSSDAVAVTSPAEIMDARLLLEPQLVTVAVTAATVDDFEELARCIRGGDAASTYDEFELWDVALHRAFARATHNTLLVSMFGLVDEARHQPLWGSLKQRTSTSRRREEYKKDHRQIAAAVQERDARGAKEAMRRHLLRVRLHTFGH